MTDTTVESVLIPAYELDELIDEKEKLEAIVKYRATYVEDLENGMKVSDPVPERSTVINRPSWISFVFMCSLMDGTGRMDYGPFLSIGLQDPGPIRTTMEEISNLNRSITRVFGPSGVVVQVQVGSKHSTEKQGETRNGKFPYYIPVAGLIVAVSESPYSEGSGLNFQGSSLTQMWSTMSALDTIISGIQMTPTSETGIHDPGPSPETASQPRIKVESGGLKLERIKTDRTSSGSGNLCLARPKKHFHKFWL